MRTILIWDQCWEPVRFAILEGDYSYLNGVYVYSAVDMNEGKVAFDNNGEHITIDLLNTFPLPLEPDDKVIVAGLL